ncbi:MAG: ATP-dependent DNA helicase RecG [Candidatus Levyibacteriota bacterium]|jgi:ATP-dependent DNA helicase RecG
MDLQTPVGQVSRTYKMFRGRLEKLGIVKLQDFLFHVPFRYDDYSLVSKIAQVQAGETVTVKGTVEEISNQYTRKWKTLQRATIKDDTGSIDILWFNQPFLTKAIRKGDLISLSGKVDLDKHKLMMISPDYEIVFNNQTIHTGRLVPVYPETKGISSKWLRRQIYKLLEEKSQLRDFLPEKIISENNLIKLTDAVEKIHFPQSLHEAERARERLAFDELFELQLASLVRRKAWERNIIKKPWQSFKEKVDELVKGLPFELTNAQKKAVDDIVNDISSAKPMNRLLEGEVGSGKTVVGTISMYVAFLNGFQTAFMAPTEILAQQHFQTISKLLTPRKVKVELITGSDKKPSNDFDVLVGTHALVYKKAEFKKLGLVIIDEQQRFGVEQRTIIREKGQDAHLLTMTATPIPRTVALTMYGDLDLSLLDEMPKGRKLVKTWLVPPEKRSGAYNWIKKQIVGNKDQVFIVCPFIEESETMIAVKAATKEFERLQNEVFPDLELGLLHGKIKAKEKEIILKAFRDKKIDILVSTPVVEVGIDIPNATIMLIEEADRFGLAQLHQLRGRVGRSDKQSYCLLFTSSKNEMTIERLKALETIYSGAQLAELDLKLRGPGQIYGTAQHGRQVLKVASFSDFVLIDKTKREAEKIFPEIDKYPELLAKTKEINLSHVSPD